MQLSRLYAFTVAPQRKSSNGVTPPGGRITINASLRNLISESIATANFPNRTSVIFEVDSRTRTNDVRDAVIEICFGNDATAEQKSKDLAKKLGFSMDNRSEACLFIIAVLSDNNERQMTLWTFPRDEAFRFGDSNGQLSIEILTDIFSRSSNLRKAGLFQGRNLRNHFLGGRVLDFQGSKSADEVANYWLRGFLECVLAMGTESGTRLLANGLKDAYDSCDSIADQEQLFSAMTAIKHAARSRWTLQDFADFYLTGKARESFIKTIPNEDSRTASFDFDVETYDKLVKYRIFKLENGVYVSSPPGEIGGSVQLSGDGERHLMCEGKVVSDKIRIRNV